MPLGGLDRKAHLEGIEIRLIAQALEKAPGNKSQAARLLKIKNSLMHNKMDK